MCKNVIRNFTNSECQYIPVREMIKNKHNRINMSHTYSGHLCPLSSRTNAEIKD